MRSASPDCCWPQAGMAAIVAVLAYLEYTVQTTVSELHDSRQPNASDAFTFVVRLLSEACLVLHLTRYAAEVELRLA